MRLLMQFYIRVPMLALAGAAAALAFAPFNFFPLLFVAFPPLIYLLDRRAASLAAPGARLRAAFFAPARLRAAFFAPARLRAAFFDGFWFGLGYFAAGIFWVFYAFAYEPALAFVGLPATAVAVAFFALYPAFALALTQLVWPAYPHPARFLLFAAFWTLAEMGRGMFFTGFAWNLLGQIWLADLAASQTAAYIGIYGLSFAAAAIAAAPAQIFAFLPWRARLMPLGAGLAVVILFAGFGAWRLSFEPGWVAGAELRIIQPSIAQQDKLNPEKAAANLARHLDLTHRALNEPGEAGELPGPVFVFWPEAALPVPLENPNLRAHLTRDLPENGFLITGAPRREVSGAGRAGRKVFNSLYVLAPGGEIVDVYDKIHLVPFGEYLPLRPLLGLLGFQALAAQRGDISHGQMRRQIELPGLPAFAPLICYEVIFSEEVPGIAPRPGLLVNLTNDGWYRTSPGPYQHFAQARMRAIEQGLPVLRAANTGISAMIDPYGRVVASAPLEAEVFLAPPLPRALPPTFYAKAGLAAPLALILAALALGLFLCARPPKRARTGAFEDI